MSIAAASQPAAGSVAGPHELRWPQRVAMVHLSKFEVDGRVQRQAHALAERGVEIEDICLSDPDELRIGPGVIRLHRVSMREHRGGAGAYLAGYAQFLAGAARRLSRLDRERPFDLVQIHNMPNLLVLAALRPKLRGAPIVLDMHDTFPELLATTYGLDWTHPVVWLLRAEERASAALADKVLAVTAEAADRLRARGVGSDRSEVVMNSPDPAVFGPRRPPVAVPATGAVRAVYHGGLSHRFGVETLIRAFGILRRRMPEVGLEIHGVGAGRDLLAGLAQDTAPEHVHVALRPTPHVDIPSRLAECHIGVVPTERDIFTELLLPVKLLEYVHMGLPVVASRLPVIEQYFSDEEIRFFEPGSVESLAEAIADVRRNPERAQGRAARASDKLAAFAWAGRQRDGYLAALAGLAPRAVEESAG